MRIIPFNVHDGLSSNYCYGGSVLKEFLPKSTYHSSGKPKRERQKNVMQIALSPTFDELISFQIKHTT